MWIFLACGSALFAGVTAVLAKCGIRHTDSTVATVWRTGMVLLMAWVIVGLTGSAGQVTGLSPKTWSFLIVSGVSTGASWLCYFKALQLGNVNQVTPVDKTSTILTILLSFVVFGEPIGLWQAVGVIAIAVGTFLMLEKKPVTLSAKEKRGHGWFFFAMGSAVFASLTALLGKAGMQGVESNLGTALRTGVVLIMAWGMVLISGKGKESLTVPRRDMMFILLSGVSTGASWLCYFKALKLGPASVVVPLDKLSLLITVAFSVWVLHESLSRRAAVGLLILTAGTLLMLLPG